ncbi:MAG: hypothetical protein CMG66_06135 [Candidatus Marinimicrobia bacterium]|nr:hypothetical protein [Candidatus Neomarinimicrobiota bacterium]|tara:strand:+ start:16222 stop:16815 length:594 start_codon:yes stop_codon:yes gene_type:complete
MSYSTSILYKIIYSSLNKKYKIIFHSIKDDKKNFSILLNNHYAKNIAMASENISSILLSQYDLFINLLTQLNLKLNSVCVEKDKTNCIAFIKISSENGNDLFKIPAYVGDAIILALKSFVDIEISNLLFVETKVDNINLYNKSKLQNKIENHEFSPYKKNTDMMLMLQTALDDCLIKENYESAAFLRDRIKELNNKK